MKGFKLQNANSLSNERSQQEESNLRIYSQTAIKRNEDNDFLNLASESNCPQKFASQREINLSCKF